MSAMRLPETPVGSGESALSEEDRARADLYAVLARLFYAAPDRDLLERLARHENLFGAEELPLGRAWRALARAEAEPMSTRQMARGLLHSPVQLNEFNKESPQ